MSENADKARATPRYLTWSSKNVFMPVGGMRDIKGRAVVGSEDNRDDTEFETAVRPSVEVHQQVVQKSLEVKERPGIERDRTDQ